MHFLDLCIPYTATTKCTVLNTYEYYKSSSDICRQRCAIFREHSMPGLKPIANDKLFCTWFHNPAVFCWLRHMTHHKERPEAIWTEMRNRDLNTQNAEKLHAQTS